MNLYIKTWCPWCLEAMVWLGERGLAFTPIDVLADAAAFAHMRRISSQTQTPTLEMPDGAVLADFDVSQLEQFLQERTGG